MKFLFPFKKEQSAILTSQFGMRTHPITRKQKLHKGIDIVIDDREITSTAEGKVIQIGNDPSYSAGRYVLIDHGEGYTSRYFHCERILAKEGQTVKAGDLIAIQGTTGDSTGEHLHFELRKGSKAFDPFEVIKNGGNGGGKLRHVEDQEHWGEKHFESLNKKRITVNERRFDDLMTRAEVMALIDRATN